MYLGDFLGESFQVSKSVLEIVYSVLTLHLTSWFGHLNYRLTRIVVTASKIIRMPMMKLSELYIVRKRYKTLSILYFLC